VHHHTQGCKLEALSRRVRKGFPGVPGIRLGRRSDQDRDFDLSCNLYSSFLLLDGTDEYTPTELPSEFFRALSVP
jgi:hypothetical protein